MNAAGGRGTHSPPGDFVLERVAPPRTWFRSATGGAVDSGVWGRFLDRSSCPGRILGADCAGLQELAAMSLPPTTVFCSASCCSCCSRCLSPLSEGGWRRRPPRRCDTQDSGGYPDERKSLRGPERTHRTRASAEWFRWGGESRGVGEAQNGGLRVRSGGAATRPSAPLDPRRRRGSHSRRAAPTPSRKPGRSGTGNTVSAPPARASKQTSWRCRGWMR